MLEHSLLGESIFRVAAADGSVAPLSLPMVLARLSAGEDLVFSALRPHQRPAWHAFLVQLAYLALESQDDPQPPQTADDWAAVLRGLTPAWSDDAPWCLVNTDWQQPAFLQAPCSAGRVADFKRTADAAQDIDVLVTARHHDEKGGKLPLAGSGLDALVFALLLLQGWSAFMGHGNYNTMRMNGGFSSRPQFRLAYSRGSGPEFLRDLAVLLESREELLERFAATYPGSDGQVQALLWLSTWDEGSLSPAEVHPLCLEICRRVRLVQEGGRLLLRRAASNAMRVAAKDLRGNVLDPWVPIVKGDQPKALTAQSHTLGYRSLHALLFDRDKCEMPSLARPSERERRVNQSGTFIAQVLVSGDGSTDGLLMRELPMPAPVLAKLVSGPEALSQRSHLFVQLAGLASGKVLRGALLQFIDGSSEPDWKNRDFTRAVEPWVDRFEIAVDEAFFSNLFYTLEAGLGDGDAQRYWVKWLAAACRSQLQAAAAALPSRDGSRRFAQARAERLLEAALRKQFGPLLSPESDRSTQAELSITPTDEVRHE